MRSIISKVLVLGATLTFAPSCDLLEREPLDQIGPSKYYNTAEQLSSFTIQLYDAFPNSIGSYSAGMATWDNGTDNQAPKEAPNAKLFSRDVWKVPAEGGLDFDNIRNVNYFISVVEGKIKNKSIAGNTDDINHYLGEAYFFRAYYYFQKLKAFGDYPIVTTPLPDDEATLKAEAKRQPRNKVARFILDDLTKAIELLRESIPNNQRISKKVAHLFRSRVALYEGTFEKYHKGSGRVPGDATWPGKDKEWNKGVNIDIDSEIVYFLTEAMNSADIVAKATTLTNNTKVDNPTSTFNNWNPYFEMFGSNNLAAYPEVLLWRQHSKAANILHHTTNRLVNGTSTGWTRSLVESFVLADGTPYEAASNRSDATIKDVKAGRDNRLLLFIFAEDDILDMRNSTPSRFTNALLLESEVKETTGYRQRKGLNYDPAILSSGNPNEETAVIYFRSAEALLNYIEASYLLKGSLSSEAKVYWEKLRERAGIATGSIEKTINETNMSILANTSRPSYDWAAFSSGEAVDATLYSIRRERRCEFAGEGFRMDDLIRWRALDQVKDYQIEGANFWTTIYSYEYFSSNGRKIVADGSATANISSKTLGNYLRPYQIIQKNNTMYNGYTFYQAHYLSPFSVKEMQLCSPTNDANNSNLYQNPGWKAQANTYAEY